MVKQSEGKTVQRSTTYLLSEIKVTQSLGPISLWLLLFARFPTKGERVASWLPEGDEIPSNVLHRPLAAELQYYSIE